MTKRCTTCDHKSLLQIEADLLSSADTQEAIAKRYGITRRALGAHRRNCMTQPVSLAKDQEIAPLELTGDPKTDAQTLLQECARILHDARKKSNIGTQIKAADSVGKKIELIAKMLGDMPSDTPRVPIMIIVNSDGKQPNTIEPGGPEQLLLG